MDELRSIVALLTLSAIILAFTAPVLAQSPDLPMASPATVSGSSQEVAR